VLGTLRTTRRRGVSLDDRKIGVADLRALSAGQLMRPLVGGVVQAPQLADNDVSTVSRMLIIYSAFAQARCLGFGPPSVWTHALLLLLWLVVLAVGIGR